MKVLFCDRCGKEIKEPERVRRVATVFHYVYFNFFGSNKGDVHNEHELCGACAETLWNWLYKGSKKGEAMGIGDRV